MRSRHLCQTLLNGGEAYPVHTWLSSWNRAMHTCIHTLYSWPSMCPADATALDLASADLPSGVIVDFHHIPESLAVSCRARIAQSYSALAAIPEVSFMQELHSFIIA